MEQNRDMTDTTIWSGVSLLLALAASSRFWEQTGIVVLGPAAGWIMLYYTKKLIAWLERKRENKKDD